jgi:hypothetical protein
LEEGSFVGIEVWHLTGVPEGSNEHALLRTYPDAVLFETGVLNPVCPLPVD